MEDQIRSNSVVSERTGPVWIVGPAFDLLLLANVAWPLLILPGMSTDQDTVVDFWQVYFLTLPHRWLTLFLVVVDPDRRGQRSRAMLIMAMALGLIVVLSYLGASWGPRAFVCLGFVDYVWNGWHFGSQHAGVLRIYSRKTSEGWPLLERWGVRSFVFLTILRTSSGLLWPQSVSQFARALAYFDFALLLIPVMLLAACLVGFRAARLSKLVYTSSVLGLYSLYLMASHYQCPRMILCMATAAALFHAVEYLAIVGYYAGRRKDSGSPGAMRWLAERWLLTFTCFAVTLGMLGVFLTHYGGELNVVWQGLNLWAALVHYSFDGMIWKLRQPATARSLGVT